VARFELTHLADSTLIRDLSSLVARDRLTTAELLAHIAEFDARRLYLPAGYPSMAAYCVGELRLSEDAAAKRIQAARAARRFPAIFAALADGRLHLTGVGLLAPYLIEATADELLAAATHKTKAEIERLLAERFPRPDVLAWVAALPGPSAPAREHAPAHVDCDPRPGLAVGSPVGEHAPAHVESAPRPGLAVGSPVGEHAPAHVERAPGFAPVVGQMSPACADGRSRLKPLSPRSFAVQFTLSRSGHDLLRQAQELLGPDLPAGDIGAVFERALQVLVPQLEKRKLAATDRPRVARRGPKPDSRHVPAEVRRAVWRRDGGRCTFVAGNGHRCEARAGLQFDHIDAYARGGEATVSGIRLLCRGHNHLEAERTYGPGFMLEKRLAAAEARATARARAAAEENAAVERAIPAGRAEDQDVVPWLRALGFGATEAQIAATRCHDLPEGTPLEARVRMAISSFRVRGARQVPADRGPRPLARPDGGPVSLAAAGFGLAGS
jgi:5-methylcytosine-specific restriction endonuclease McrA